jgi:hypothetical protein
MRGRGFFSNATRWPPGRRQRKAICHHRTGRRHPQDDPAASLEPDRPRRTPGVRATQQRPKAEPVGRPADWRYSVSRSVLARDPALPDRRPTGTEPTRSRWSPAPVTPETTASSADSQAVGSVSSGQNTAWPRASTWPPPRPSACTPRPPPRAADRRTAGGSAPRYRGRSRSI